MDIWKHILDESSYDQLTQLRMIKTLMDLHQNHAAVILLNDLLKSAQQRHLVLTLRAQSLMNEGNFEAAFSDLQKAVKIKPDFAPALYYMGQLLVQRSQNEEAKEIFERLKKLAPEEAGIYHYLGLIAHIRQEKEKAIRYWQKALRKDPNFSPAYYNLKLYDIHVDHLKSLNENLEDMKLMKIRTEIENKIRILNNRKDFQNGPYKFYWGSNGFIYLNEDNFKSFTWLEGEVRYLQMDKPHLKELMKIIESLMVELANEPTIDQIFWEMDYGKGQYFLYLREKLSEAQWQSYSEGRYQSKKVPEFLKLRMVGNGTYKELPFRGNIFLLKQDKSFHLFENLGTDKDYSVIDVLDRIPAD
ncbi:MAG: hypothetical protein Kow00108_21680 [Calditrichia bacterium]